MASLIRKSVAYPKDKVRFSLYIVDDTTESFWIELFTDGDFHSTSLSLEAAERLHSMLGKTLDLRKRMMKRKEGN